MNALPCSPSDWPRFSALLDHCLELEPAAREAWLDTLADDDRRFRDALQALLLRSERRSGDWLETPAGAADAQPPAFVEGERIGPWRLLRPLGSGGMGAVWLAARADGAYQREVALKLPHAHLLGGALRERFGRERDILAALSDPRIARFYDSGIDDEQPWLALEYVRGTQITDYCERRALSVRERVALLREVAAAVQAAHARLIVHRDLKPANVMATEDGQIKLLDFGIAKLLDDDPADSGLTQLGGRAATPDYAAPEQLDGSAITVATDVYALGVMLYELLTGERPFPARSRLGRLIETRGDAPQASTRVGGKRRAELAGDLDAILAKAMEPDPAKRYGSVEAFSADLARYLAHQPIQARRIGRWRRAAKFAHRHRQGVAVAAMLVLALGTGLAGVLWQSQRAAEEARRASAIKDFLVEIFAASDPRTASDQPRGNITAKALLDAGAAKIESRFADDPEVQIELMRTIADLYAQLGEDERYEALQALQLKKVRDRFGPLHPNILNGAVETALRACSRAERAICVARVADADRLLKASGDQDPHLRAQWWLARGLQLQGEDGRIDEAERAYASAVDLYRRHDPRSRGMVTSLHELASFYTSMKLDHARAIATYNETLALAESLPDRNDAELQTLYGNLGLVHQQLGQFAEAAEAFRKSADYAERTTGAEFPTAWVPRVNAARTLHLAGQRQAAHREFARLLPLLPDDGRHAAEVAAVREVYGERVSSEGRPELGIPHLEAAVASYARQSSHSFKLRLARRYLGEAYARAGRDAEAGRMLKAALDEYLQQQSDSEQPVMAIRESWGRWLLERGLLDEARAQFDTIVAHADGRNFAHVALAHGGLARIALAEARTADALRESGTAIAGWKGVTGFRDVRMGPYLQRIHADALAANGRLGAAQAEEDAAVAASVRYDAPGTTTTQRRRMTAPR